MSGNAKYINDWNRLFDELTNDHQFVLRSTLPTPSFSFLLEREIRECKERLTQLDLSRDAVDFKERYRSIRLQQDLAENLLLFIKSLTLEKPDGEIK